MAFQAAGATVMISTFVEGVCLDRDDPQKVRLAGAALAGIHRAGEGLSGPAATRSAADLDQDSPDLRDSDLDAWHSDFIRRDACGMTRGLVHGDFWAENLKWTTGGEVAVIDWGGAHCDVHMGYLDVGP
jgi:Ser/Thr protein kinase RdoA (MazF antagonist)